MNIQIGKLNALAFISLRMIVLVLIMFSTTLLNAQENKWEVKGDQNNYILYGSRKGKTEGKFIIYSNSNYNDDELKKIRKHVDINEFYLYRINNHELFISAFKNSFTDNRIKELVQNDETIKVTFILDENGKIMAVYFMLLSSTSINVYEIEKLENELLKVISFIVTNPIEDNSFGSFAVRTSFKEILKGEIKAIRNNEKSTEEYL